MFEYMIYYSKNKTEMLYEQICNDASYNTLGRLGFNLGVINGEITSTEQLQNNNMYKLNTVLKYLHTKKLVGGIKEHKDYISGPLTMGWETFDITHWGTKILFHEENHMYVVTLFGSKDNINGPPYKGTFDSHSIYPYYVKFAKEHFNNDKVSEPNLWQLMEGINGEYTGEFLQYEFVAKVLYRETISLEYKMKNNRLVNTIEPMEKTTYILATPLYVCLPHRATEKIRRINGKNYVAIDDFSTKLNSKREINKMSKKLTIILENALLLEEAAKFKMEIDSAGENISKLDFIKIAEQYFVIED